MGLLGEPKAENRFPTANSGVVERLMTPGGTQTAVSKRDLIYGLISAFGISFDPESPPLAIAARFLKEEDHEGVRVRSFLLRGYDDVEIPFYELRPAEFSETNTHSTIICFSGHGNVDQLVYDASSYQRAGAMEFARGGFLTYAMENRGMGDLGYLGDHIRIDAVARLTGGSWMGEILTDAFYILSFVYDRPYVDVNRIGAAGVSTGGALSMFVSAMDARISAVFVQGYLGSYRTTFGMRGNHHECNNVAGLLKYGDMAEFASLTAPRSLLFVNGSRDIFFPEDARKAFELVRTRYRAVGGEDRVDFRAPTGVAHEFSPEIATRFFILSFRDLASRRMHPL